MKVTSGGAPLAAASGPTLIARPSRLAEVAADQLRTLIFDGTLPPGSLLRQEDLAARLGISRTPLRESLRLLDLEGLIETAPSGASRVVDLNGAAAVEAMEVREVIDGLVARLWARRGLPAARNRALAAIVDQMDRASSLGDKKEYMAGNASFHLELLRGLEHRWLDQFTSLVRVSSQATYLRLESGTARLRLSAAEHRAILGAIDAGRPEEAEHLAREHVANAARHWVLGRGEQGGTA